MGSRHWCWTLFCDRYDWFPFFEHEAHRYTVVQREVCPETGNEHWQGYTELFKPMRKSQMKWEIIGDSRVRLFERKGSRLEARIYCMEEETRLKGWGPYEFGEWNKKGQGNRTDHDEVAKEIKSVGLIETINTYPGHYIRFHGGMHRLDSHYHRNKLRKIKVREGEYEEGMYCVQYGDKLDDKFAHYDGEDTIFVPRGNRHMANLYESGRPLVVNKRYAAWKHVVYEKEAMEEEVVWN